MPNNTPAERTTEKLREWREREVWELNDTGPCEATLMPIALIDFALAAHAVLTGDCSEKSLAEKRREALAKYDAIVTTQEEPQEIDLMKAVVDSLRQEGGGSE